MGKNSRTTVVSVHIGCMYRSLTNTLTSIRWTVTRKSCPASSPIVRNNMGNEVTFWGPLIVYGVLINGPWVSSENVDEQLDLVEGDITGFANDPDPTSLDHPGGVHALLDDVGRWPDNVIPYKFQQGYAFELRHLFKQATHHIAQRTCIRFQPHSDEPNYIRVISGIGCYSKVGNMHRGAQDVSLPQKCADLGIFVHELLHAIGFNHEQSRRDRNQYVTINWDNIDEKRKHNFWMKDDPLRLPYDYQSIMHYDRVAFSKQKNGETITPRKEGIYIGQRRGMSAGDIAEVNARFCGGSAERSDSDYP